MRKATFLIELAEQHRRVWHHTINNESLARIPTRLSRFEMPTIKFPQISDGFDASIGE